MIAWMQKHNKYLVVTIWIATIAFIGAGFVGWGTYQYGAKAGAVARVGDVTISQERYNYAYQNLYRETARAVGRGFDDAKAKEMQLPRRAYNRLVAQAYLLNLAREYGIVVSEEELARSIAEAPAFRDKGKFSKQVYMAFLRARGMKAKSFEAIVRDDLVVEKLMNLLSQNAVPFEREAVASALGTRDKIRYEVLTPETVAVHPDETALKKFWEERKERYLTPRMFRLAILWTATSDLNVSEKALKAFYRKNSFNYVDAEGKELAYEAAKARVERDYRIRKGKKKALLDYIALKKGKKKPAETRLLAQDDPLLPAELWEAIRQSGPGELIKPKPAGERYVTVRVEEVVPPRPMRFEEARKAVEEAWTAEAKNRAMKAKAEALAAAPEKLTKVSGYLSMTRSETLPPLSPQESSQLLKKLFTSDQKVGIISINKKMVVYRIVDQKIGESDDNLAKEVGATTDRIKRSEFERELLRELSAKYPVTSFVKGF